MGNGAYRGRGGVEGHISRPGEAGRTGVRQHTVGSVPDDGEGAGAPTGGKGSGGGAGQAGLREGRRPPRRGRAAPSRSGLRRRRPGLEPGREQPGPGGRATPGPHSPRSNFLPSGSMSFTSKMSSKRIPAMAAAPRPAPARRPPMTRPHFRHEPPGGRLSAVERK